MMIHGTMNVKIQSITLKMEAEDFSETFVTSYHNILHHNYGKMISLICTVIMAANLAL
jgi:hypothetical protein